MTERDIRWERLPDRTTPKGETLQTERAEIDGTVWYHGTIPPPSRPKRRGWLARIIRLRG